MKTRCYSELRKFVTIEDRFEYLKLNGSVGYSTFGFDRWINQEFYRSAHWRQARDEVIRRDLGCDLGIPGYEIHSEILVHHMNPITKDEIVNGVEWILDPEFLITTTKKTHNALHYGDSSRFPYAQVDRKPGDTNLWPIKTRRR